MKRTKNKFFSNSEKHYFILEIIAGNDLSHLHEAVV